MRPTLGLFLPLLTGFTFAQGAEEPPPAPTAVVPGAEAHWPHWRGPFGTGVATSGAPLQWSDEEGVTWKKAIPGRGHSTPIVWGQKLFLTTALSVSDGEGEDQDASAGGEEFHGGGGQYPEQAFLVVCFDAESGELLWERTASEAIPHEGYHKTYGSFASIAPLTDGERLYCSFGSFGVHCFDLEGEPLWSHDFAVKMHMRNEFGEGAAPGLVDGKLVFNFDQEGESFAAALDARTGEELWRVTRDEPSSWTTPLSIPDAEPPLAVIAATSRVRAYEASSGKLVWQCGGLGLNAIPMPVRHGDLVLAMTGFREPNLIAIRLGREGDLTGTDAVVWSTTKDTAYTASPVLHEGIYYVVTDRGQLSAFDAETGEALYRAERLPRGSRLKASPIAAGGFLYVATEEGFVHLVRLGRKFEVVHTNQLGEELFIASPIAVGGALYLRGPETLFCIRTQD